MSRANEYLQLCTQRNGHVAEAEPVLDPFSERHLHCIWFDNRLRPEPLQTERGERIQIIHPGKWNQESGPDFLNAEWKVGGRRVRGDVEIHIRPMDWKHHGHRDDLRYAGVGLHVCYEPGELPPGLLPPGCEEVSMRGQLEKRSHFFFDQIDVRAYPWQKEGATSGLRGYFAGKSEEECGAMLEAAGQERLRRKSLRMARVVQAVGEEQALYMALLRGLGYKNNAEVSEGLARGIPYSLLKSLAGNDPEKSYALLLGVAGLLPADADAPGLPRWMNLRRLWDLWWPHQHTFLDKSLSPEAWRLDHCRTGNHPVRRLRAAATWVAQAEGLSMLFSVKSDQPEKMWIRDCLKKLRVASPEATVDPTQLVGPVRAGTLFLNAILPWRICSGKILPEEELWSQLPDEAFNSKSRHAANMLFGPDQHPRLYRGGLRKQGLLQFYEDFQL
ncbi:DUF2851 family protein [Kiritimatiellaeota bacterium B1221]|nr:DUF2851 family protein [Kiritimatiellaeota bacterium B1221]